MKVARRRSAKAGPAAPKRAAPPAPKSLAPRQIPIDAIDWSSALRDLNVLHVRRLADAAQLPAVTVWEFEPGRFRGVDGYHRWRLAKARGEKGVAALLVDFPAGKAGEKAFDFASVQSNLRHGLPLTREERDRAIVRIWSRWGHGSARAEGETLDSLGSLFNLTKQRIHQIVTAGDNASASHATQSSLEPGTVQLASGQAAQTEAGRSHMIGRGPAPGGFSSFGRFSASTRRLSGLLGDTEFLGKLLVEHRSEVRQELQRVRGLIDQILGLTG